MASNSTDQSTAETDTDYYGRRVVSFRAGDDRIDLLDDLCRKYSISRSELLRTAIRQIEEADLDE